MSNLLGDVYEPVRASAIISGGELVEREGVDLQKGMTFRDLEDRISVFLVLQHDGEFKDRWDARGKRYYFRGHDSVTTDGPQKDQVAMYESGRLSENGKFLKAIDAKKGGLRPDPLSVQIYEKLDAGVWFDKGIFTLENGQRISDGDRKVFEFELAPADIARIADDAHHGERMMSATEKARIWEKARGRCSRCGTQSGLRFMPEGEILCVSCRGESIGLLG